MLLLIGLYLAMILIPMKVSEQPYGLVLDCQGSDETARVRTFSIIKWVRFHVKDQTKRFKRVLFRSLDKITIPTK